MTFLAATSHGIPRISIRLSALREDIYQLQKAISRLLKIRLIEDRSNCLNYGK